MLLELEPLLHLVFLEQRVVLVPLVQVVPQATLVLLEQQEILVPQVMLVPQVIQVLMATRYLIGRITPPMLITEFHLVIRTRRTVEEGAVMTQNRVTVRRFTTLT